MILSIDLNYQATQEDIIVEYELAPSAEGAFHSLMEYIQQGVQTGMPEQRHKDPSMILHGLNVPEQRFQIAFKKKHIEDGNIIQNFEVFSSIPLRESHQRLSILSIEWNGHNSFANQQAEDGITSIRNLLDIPERPLVSSRLLPNISAQYQQYIENAYHLWQGGCDIIEETSSAESIASQRGKERLQFMAKEQESATKRASSHKLYIPHLSHLILDEMVLELQQLSELNIRIAKISAHLGWSGIYKTLRHAQFADILIAIDELHPLRFLKPQISLSEETVITLLKAMGVSVIHCSTRSSVQTAAPELHKVSSNDRRSFPIIRLSQSFNEVEPMTKSFGKDLIFDGTDIFYKHPDRLRGAAEECQKAITSITKGLSIPQSTNTAKIGLFD